MTTYKVAHERLYVNREEKFSRGLKCRLTSRWVISRAHITWIAKMSFVDVPVNNITGVHNTHKRLRQMALREHPWYYTSRDVEWHFGNPRKNFSSRLRYSRSCATVYEVVEYAMTRWYQIWGGWDDAPRTRRPLHTLRRRAASRGAARCRAVSRGVVRCRAVYARRTAQYPPRSIHRAVSCGIVRCRAVPCGIVRYRAVSCGVGWFMRGVSTVSTACLKYNSKIE